MSLPNSARVVRCVSAGNWAATGPVTKNKNREERRNICIYLEREQQEDVFSKSFKWIGQGKVLFFRAFYGVFRLMFMVSMGE